MAEDAETLRRRIALYRNYLRDGVDSDLARLYLDEIMRAEHALAKIEGGPKEAPPRG
jgi:hypothetical protein